MFWKIKRKFSIKTGEIKNVELSKKSKDVELILNNDTSIRRIRDLLSIDVKKPVRFYDSRGLIVSRKCKLADIDLKFGLENDPLSKFERHLKAFSEISQSQINFLEMDWAQRIILNAAQEAVSLDDFNKLYETISNSQFEYSNFEVELQKIVGKLRNSLDETTA